MTYGGKKIFFHYFCWEKKLSIFYLMPRDTLSEANEIYGYTKFICIVYNHRYEWNTLNRSTFTSCLVLSFSFRILFGVARIGNNIRVRLLNCNYVCLFVKLSDNKE